MHFNRKLLLAVVFVTGLLSVNAAAQCPAMPAGFLCISQAAGNAAAENKRELDATREKVAVLEEALKLKDANVTEIREAARVNEAALTERLHKTETELALKTGQLIGTEAEKTRLIAIIDVLLKQVRPKKIGLVNLF